MMTAVKRHGPKTALFSVLGFIFFFNLHAHARANEIERWVEGSLSDEEIISIVDRESEIDRPALISQLVAVLFASPMGGKDAFRSATVLCQIDPWTSGDSGFDNKVQRTLWEQGSEYEIWADSYAIFDCASANIKDFYFDNVVGGAAKIRRKLCSEGFYEKQYSYKLDQFINQIESVDNVLLQGGIEYGKYSYYPLRNSLRLALLYAYRGVVTSDSDFEMSRLSFGMAANTLDEWNTTERLTKTRNGWRFHADLSILASIYRALSGSSDAVIELRAHRDWVSARNDPVFLSSAGPDLTDPESPRAVPADYMDPVYIERILPSAAETPDDECSRWRRRAYRPDRVADQALRCLGEGGLPNSRRELLDFDSCFASLVAEDWRIQFETFSTAVDGIERMNVIKEKLIAAGLEHIASEVRLKKSETKNLQIITTEPIFTTQEIQNTRPKIAKVLRSALYARNKQY